jgi:hypothetical protein
MKALLPFIVASLFILALVGCGMYLVILEHYGWAWIPFLIAGCVSVKRSENDNTNKE